MLKKLLVVLMVLTSLAVGWAGETFTLKVVDSGTGSSTVLTYDKFWGILEDIKKALVDAGVDMTGVKPAGYAAKIAQAGSPFSFDVTYKAIAHYDYISYGNTPVIPSTIRGHTVETIGLGRGGAFWSGFRDMPLKYVVFPEQPLDIQLTTFYGCGLKAISIPASSTVGNVAFAANLIVFAKLAANVTIYDDSSASAYAGLKTAYVANGSTLGYFVYTGGSWKELSTNTSSFSMENAPITASDYADVFDLLPTVSSESIVLTGGYGLSGVSSTVKAVATAKGWNLIE